MGGALGGAIAAQPAIREIGGVSRYRGAIAAIVSPIAVTKTTKDLMQKIRHNLREPGSYILRDTSEP